MSLAIQAIERSRRLEELRGINGFHSTNPGQEIPIKTSRLLILVRVHVGKNFTDKYSAQT